MNLDVSSWLQVAILQYGMTVQGSTGTTPRGLPTPTRSPYQGEHCRFRHAYRLLVTQPGQRPVAGVRA